MGTVQHTVSPLPPDESSSDYDDESEKAYERLVALAGEYAPKDAASNRAWIAKLHDAADVLEGSKVAILTPIGE